MTTIELLEERIAELEKQIYGLEKTEGANDTMPESCIIDNLLHINTLISTSVSGRTKANAVIKRLPELNEYMDPAYESTKILIDAKIQFLIAIEPQIKENYKLLTQMQELMPVLETERIRNVPELTNKLNELNLSYIKLYKSSEQLNNNINEVFSKYDAVITSISKTLIALDSAVTAAEIAAMPKKQTDD